MWRQHSAAANLAPPWTTRRDVFREQQPVVSLHFASSCCLTRKETDASREQKGKELEQTNMDRPASTPSTSLQLLRFSPGLLFSSACIFWLHVLLFKWNLIHLNSNSPAFIKLYVSSRVTCLGKWPGRTYFFFF